MASFLPRRIPGIGLDVDEEALTGIGCEAETSLLEAGSPAECRPYAAWDTMTTNHVFVTWRSIGALRNSGAIGAGGMGEV